ncbi:DNA-formamidopyrimidine glycosylase family protein [Pedobacter caeni]|uniref:Formamidopyrimidine-DNA glycosylase n=1 Tax=Pedobacter caeni TaxID=288992 RepID=A0A1M5C098_9SPHI|nr:DNA-formamidopyrimidine glycosylase family protein [Pedobacter caeni]SHF48037.1 formamidopyrimidine-DNA glycosylase [Pedobacter caeni]
MEENLPGRCTFMFNVHQVPDQIMLELPYLEVCAEMFERKFKNRVLLRLDIPHKKYINVSITELTDSLIGKDLKKVWREGLSLYFQFRNHAVLEMCLSASAELFVVALDQEDKAGLMDFYFSGGQILSVKDIQHLCKFRLNPIHTAVPDVLSKDITVEYLVDLFTNRSEEIKYVLTDQRLIRGIGDAYADEILWYAEISPFSIAGKIPLDRIKVLHKTIKYVLLDAIKEARKITSWKFIEAGADLLMIHNPDKKDSPTRWTIKMKVILGIKTYYTDEQHLYV